MLEQYLDAEFATVIYDKITGCIYAARDKYGVRPLFYGINNDATIIAIASEMKAIPIECDIVEPVNPRKYIKIKDTIKFKNYAINLKDTIIQPDTDKIRSILIKSVEKRLESDRPIGFLLSGGLDSSLIVSIAVNILGPDNIICFTIGFEGSPDVEAAKEVAKHLKIKNHHIVPFNTHIGLDNIESVIKITETYDVTTVRASTPQYVMAKYIRDNTNIKVLLSGEGSDEIHGSYRYFRDAPSVEAFDEERHRLLDELYMFDNLRTDRTMASCGLEVRVPFLDYEYVKYVMNISGQYFMYKSDYIEKQLIRDCFKGWLPDNILYRSKEAFSDAVSNTNKIWYKEIINMIDKDFDYCCTYNPPKTLDAKYFRMIFDKFYKHPNVISHYWLPRFQKEDIFDPSATVLQSY
jgi:asparagine synthase (glutamine-hydrolysing)